LLKHSPPYQKNRHDTIETAILALHLQKQDDYKVIQYMKEQTTYAHMGLVALVLEEEKTGIERTVGVSNVRYLVKPFAIQEAVALVSASLEHI
jgi:DNA-binding response OmpR family regulator